jgi:hypothetical protein
MKPGIYDMTAGAYHADPCEQPSLSSSIIKVLCSSTPWHAWTEHPRLNPDFAREDKEIFDLGTVAHALMLQGLEAGRVLDFPDWRKADARAARDEARAAGETPILAKHWDRVQAMVSAGKAQLAAHKEASDAFTDGMAEQTLIWTDDHGVQCKARLDWIKRDHERIYDYKATGTSVDPESLGKYATSQGWDIQAAFYKRGMQEVFGVDPDFLFVAQEDYPPYALAVLGLTEETLTTGEKKVQHGIDIFSKCMESGKWPGYPQRICAVPFDIWDAERWAIKEAR